MEDKLLKEQPSRIGTGLKNIGMATLKGAGGAVGSFVKNQTLEATGSIGAGFGAGFSREREKQNKEANDARKSAIKGANLAGRNNKTAKSASDTSKSNNIDEATKKQSIFNEDMVQQTKVLADSIVSIDQRVNNLETGQRNIQTDINRIMFMLEEIKGSRPKGVDAAGGSQQQAAVANQNSSLLQSLLSSAVGGALAPVLARIGASLIAATPALIAGLPYAIATALMAAGLYKLSSSIMEDEDFKKMKERSEAKDLSPEQERQEVNEQGIKSRNDPAYREDMLSKREAALKKNNAVAGDVVRSISNYIVLKDQRVIDINTGEEVDKSLALDEKNRAQIDPRQRVQRSVTPEASRSGINLPIESFDTGTGIGGEQLNVASPVNATPIGSENVTGATDVSVESVMAQQEQQRQATTLAERKDLSVKGNEIDIDSKSELNLTGRSIKIEGTGAQTILFKSPNIKFEADKIEFVYTEKSERKIAASGVTPTDNQSGGATPDAAGGGATPVAPPAGGGTTPAAPSAAGGAGAGGGTTPGGAPVTATTGTNKQILDTIKKRESGNNYTAKARGSTASGAYQFINGTWSTLTRKFNIGTEYATARDAPPEIQDKVADAYVSDILRRANGDVSKVPLEWYTGNIAGKMSASAIAANKGLTAQSYQSGWMAEYTRQGGKIKKDGDSPGATPTGSTPATTAPSATPAAPSGSSGAAPSAAGMSGASAGAATAETAEAATPGGSASPGATPSGSGGGNIRQAQSGTRRQPINNKLNSVLSSAARAAGVDVTVTSGGQPEFPKGPRVGSKRHDLGNAADLDLYSGGKILSDANPADVELKKKFVSAATSAGASGVGAGYMGPTKIHVGFGTPAKWGGASWLSGITPGSGTAEGSATPSSGGGGGATPAGDPAPVTPSTGGGSSASMDDSPNAQMTMASTDTGSSLNERSSTAEVDTRVGSMKTPQNETPSTKVIQNTVQQASSSGGQNQDQQSMGSFMAAPDESYFSSSGFTSVTPDPAFYGPGGKSGFSAGRLG